jgi:UDP-N-acetylmuramoyl-tripeptide--D-alanyl-D-alanine ligase
MFSVKELLEATGGRLLKGKLTLMVPGLSIDSRTIQPGELFVALRGDRFDGHTFLSEVRKKKACGAIVDQRSGVNADSVNEILIEVADPLRALQEIACFHRKRFSIPVVGITGSNGKTTTKEMAAAILGRRMKVLKNVGNLNNHIGVPLTLLSLTREHQLALIEMGINHPGELTRLCEIALPNMGLITNIGPTHLEFLGSIEGVARAKGELLQALKDDESVAFLNADDPFTVTLRLLHPGSVVTFGLDQNADVQAMDVTCDQEGSSFRLRPHRRREIGVSADSEKMGREVADRWKDIPMDEVAVQLAAPGRHNVYNAVGAAAIASKLGADTAEIKTGLEIFRPIQLRSQVIKWRGVTILNDSYNANPASMRSALETLKLLRGTGRAVAVLGDMLELGKESEAAHREIGRQIGAFGLDYLLTVGELARLVGRAAIEKGMPKDRVKICEHLDEARTFLKGLVREQDTVLVKGSRGMRMERLVQDLMGD